MTAGRRDQLIVIQRASATQAASGEETATWAEHAQEWAAVFYGRGDERRRAAMEQGQQAATFQVLANNSTRSVNLRDRIQHESSTWDIVSIAPMGDQHIEFTGVRSL